MTNLLSLMSLPIKVYSGTCKVYYGTGFLYYFKGNLWLVSNWHLFTNRSPLQPDIVQRGGVPTHISFFLRFFDSQGTFRRWECEMKLIDGERSCWIQHRYGPPYDVAAIRIPDISVPLPAFPRNGAHEGYNFVSNLHWGVASECFVVGFPQVKGNKNNLPVWKRATVATEPGETYDSLPVFLVDTLSSGGMSGSPVILYHTGPYVDQSGATVLKRTIGQSGPTRTVQFIGIYSGRYTENDDLAPQFGKVWHVEVIEEMLSDSAPGFYAIEQKTE